MASLDGFPKGVAHLAVWSLDTDNVLMLLVHVDVVLGLVVLHGVVVENGECADMGATVHIEDWVVDAIARVLPEVKVHSHLSADGINHLNECLGIEGKQTVLHFLIHDSFPLCLSTETSYLIH